MPAPVLDLSFRPRTYWLFPDPSRRALATVRGERERFARAALATADAAGYLDALDPDEGPCIGASPASLLAGEHLPRPRANEVEIARIAYASTLGDVVSVRARRAGGRIRYSIVDDFVDDRSELPYAFRPRSSSAPLTMGQLVDLIDEVVDPWADGRAGLVLSVAEEQLVNDVPPERCAGFIRVSSVQYPQLGAYYRRELAAWRDRVVAQQEAEEREERRRELLERRAQLRRERAEDRLIEASPPTPPWEVPADLTIRAVGRVELGLLERWLRTVPGLADATLDAEHRRGRWGASPEHHLAFRWSEEGRQRLLEAGPGGTVRDAFRKLAAEVPALAAILPRD